MTLSIPFLLFCYRSDLIHFCCFAIDLKIKAMPEAVDAETPLPVIVRSVCFKYATTDNALASCMLQLRNQKLCLKQWAQAHQAAGAEAPLHDRSAAQMQVEPGRPKVGKGNSKLTMDTQRPIGDGPTTAASPYLYE